MNPIHPGRRPSIAEVRDYYAREDVLNELLQAMQHWHVKFVPGYAPSRWVYTQDPRELRSMIVEPLDLMERYPERQDYPYFRIYGQRHCPAHSWDEGTLWGYDFVIEKDAYLWQECFEAMLPVMDILEHFGVYYWLKYTGHHSLHLVIPAEVYPRTFRGIPLKDKYEAVHHRLMVFLNKRAAERYNEHDRHCPPGTNMPYSVNEDTGLLNYPLLREELQDFRPWHASVHLARVRDFWRTVPQDACGKAGALLDELMRPWGEQTVIYPPISHPKVRPVDAERPGSISGVQRTRPQADVPLEQAIEMLDGDGVLARRFAAWTLMRMEDGSSLPALVEALADEDADVRWFAAEALFRFGHLDAMPRLLEMGTDDMAAASFVDFCVKWGEPAVLFLVEALRTWFEPTRRSLPIDKALERIGDASRPLLVEMLADDEAENREKASAILNRLSGRPSIEQATKLSYGRRPKQRRLAARMLAWYDEPRAAGRLIEMTGDRNGMVRKEAIKALGWVDHPELERVFQRALSDPDAKVRRWARRGLETVTALKSFVAQHRPLLEPTSHPCEGSAKACW
jgi:hypothetical protein